MSRVCGYHTVQQAYKFEDGGGSCGQVQCYCDYDMEADLKYLKQLSEYDKTLVQKWIYGEMHQPLESTPSNAWSVSRCRSCRYIQAFLYEHGKNVLETCECTWSDADDGRVPGGDEHPLVIKWLGRLDDGEGEPTAAKRRRQQQQPQQQQQRQQQQ